MNAPHRAIGDSPRDGPSRRWLLALLMITAFAAWLRFPALDVRPMQGDEAVHAIKLDELLRTGRYVYDPHEYHGRICQTTDNWRAQWKKRKQDRNRKRPPKRWAR